MTFPSHEERQHIVEDTIRARRSTRAFLPRAVERSVIESILRLASCSPSGTNTQPWRVHVVTGQCREQLIRDACAAYDQDPARSDRSIYANLNGEPYLSRKRTLGKAMYGLIGIQKGDTARMHAQQRRNFELFGAPVGLFVTMDKHLGPGSWLDTGMFMQTLMLAAQAYGLNTCPQAVWLQLESVVARVVGWPETEQLVSVISLGYGDSSFPENALRSERVPVEEFAVFHD